MTVICFDGKTLAADRQATCEGMRSSITKIFRMEDGTLLAMEGAAGDALLLVKWAYEGFDPAHFPRLANHANLWVIKPDGAVSSFEGTPVPMDLHDKTFVAGTGRGLAKGALAMGASARQAVQVACDYHVECGMGIDTLELGG
jgi:hypothetical protein